MSSAAALGLRKTPAGACETGKSAPAAVTAPLKIGIENGGYWLMQNGSWSPSLLLHPSPPRKPIHRSTGLAQRHSDLICAGM